MYDLLIDLVKLLVAGVAGGGLMGGIVAIRKQRAEEPLTAAQVAESTSATLGDGYRTLLAEQRASNDRTVAQLERTEARLVNLETRFAQQAARIDELEEAIEDRNRQIAIWEMWHRHNLVPNWNWLRERDSPPPPPAQFQ